ncbi:chaperone modulator CbpM [Flavobacterium silvaticum]|uniref:MerR family transcriptional regulator n=1 Tax=Flavobacterium silvaticum TaxID=1852020 RepID=A0A972FVU8_9FLAO|nr:chaperone modulator CbpM [Flavobacterium silvaticum]NMH28972.1 hypothetical protein [Flavobacterium silvaticum]
MSNRITVTQFCSFYKTDPEFFEELAAHGIMDFESEKNEIIIDDEQLSELEKLRYWRYELQINPEGIDVIRQLLQRQHKLISDLDELKRQLALFK